MFLHGVPAGGSFSDTPGVKDDAASNEIDGNRMKSESIGDPKGSNDHVLPPASPVNSKYGGYNAAFFKIFGERISLISSDIFRTKTCKPKDTIFALPPFMLKNLKKMHIKHLFPVQKELILRLGNFRSYNFFGNPGDIYVCTHTGSGKTLSYAIPIVKLLYERATPMTRALVLAPTRGLADQINSVFVQLATGSGLNINVLTGDTKDTQGGRGSMIEVFDTFYSRTADIVIATPGALIKYVEHLKQLDLSHIEYLVIDEADCLFDQDFGDWNRIIPNAGRYLSGKSPAEVEVSGIIASSRNPQKYMNLSTSYFVPLRKLLFSATISYDPTNLSTLNLECPEFIGEKKLGTNDSSERLDKYFLPKTISESIIICLKSSYKPLSLLKIIADYNLDKTLVFVRSTEAASRLAMLIEIAHRHGIQFLVSEGYNPILGGQNCPQSTFCRSFSSDLPSNQRKQVLSAFSLNKLKLLITTAVMARGMDVKDIKAVINYDIPTSAKTYLHRVGRTGRAGCKGTAFTIVLTSQAKWFKNEMKNIERCAPMKKIVHSDFKAVLPLYNKVLDELKSATYPQLRKMDGGKT